MTLRNSETLFRILIALALGIGFVGFATHSHASQHAVVAQPAQQLEANREQPVAAVTETPEGVRL